jgi:hypothetical protein
MDSSVDLSGSLREFIASSKWTYAKTMPEWPHEYIVRGRVPENLFAQLVLHIQANGYLGQFYQKSIVYFDYESRTYWTMGSDPDNTTIINRCKKEDTYSCRLRNGALPPDSSA